MSKQSFEVILTHEHTDFDALASLFGAFLLFPDALPVLPYAINRNVANFLVLYKNHFPFLQPRELPKGIVRHAVLVDTAKANHPKGMQKETKFTVIDHHSFEQPLPENWQLWSEPVGANTTLIVEKLIEQHQPLSPVQATLLALGIHEDTGSLTYVGTTHRDAACLAWLLRPEHAVNLEVIKQFLNHPLSEEQRTLLNTLIARSEFIEVVGNTAVIAQADAKDFTGELSTLAHRLVAFHEQDAIFLVIGTGDVVQVVARSSTDSIDVGAIARALGGGGHVRAAAAPVHQLDSTDVRNQIVTLLQQHSRAAITVRHIMSVGTPKTVSPDMTAQEAAELMRRYGHEGFPVVKKNGGGIQELVGTLTRREVDRTLNHNMGSLPVSRIMQSGRVSVLPNDSISTLRNRMINSNWGQIPVVDEAGQIIGIVTRTDLIKLWDASGFSTERKAEVDQKLRGGLTPTQYALLRGIGREADTMNYMAYIVGGYVRDLLLDALLPKSHELEVDSLDIDCVVEGDAIAFARRLQSIYGGRVILHKRFGMAKWLLTDENYPVQLQTLRERIGAECVAGELPGHLDFVSARTEFYTAPTVLPTVERSSIKLDLLRRDFSINTLAICLSQNRWGDLLDLFGGVHDLNRGIIQVLHSLSFVDDPTRILRAVRYEQRFGFQIDPRTLELLQDAIDLLERVSPTRIRHELERIFQEEKPENILQRLDHLGILSSIHPALEADGILEQRFDRLRRALAENIDDKLAQEPIDLLYWGAWVQDLSGNVHAELTQRLALQSKTVQLVKGLSELNQHRAQLSEKSIAPSHAVAILDRINPLALTLYTTVNEQLDDGPNGAFRTTLQHYFDEWQFIRPLLNGNDLKQMGIPRGPLYAKILTRLRAAWLDGEIDNRAAEEELALQIASE
ncbi:CBS domain-containing protein [Chloroflexi bacterium TSY]|nr:CBS domain-containing protein [Chloroflexi bacterium TSY]